MAEVAVQKPIPNSDNRKALQKLRAAYPSESEAQIFARFLAGKNEASQTERRIAQTSKAQLTLFDAPRISGPLNFAPCDSRSEL
jgi:soluble lytic murein transglycosylase-like protein